MSSLKEFLTRLKQDALGWCKGKTWAWRLPLLIWFFYIFLRHLSNANYNSVLGALNLGLHELGHLIFSPFGTFISIAGGTLLQCLIPFFGMINFYRQEDYFSLALCFGWLSTNFFDVARYIADARAMNLPLVSPFGQDAIHDWNYMLEKIGGLNFDLALANIFKLGGILSMLICLFAGGWLVLQMMVLPRDFSGQ